MEQKQHLDNLSIWYLIYITI